MLALRGTFLYKLWISIKSDKSEEALAQQYNFSHGSWTYSHTAISVFCCMFILYKATLTDTGKLQQRLLVPIQDIFWKKIL